MIRTVRQLRAACGRRGAMLILFGTLNILTGVRIFRIPGAAPYVHSYIDDVLPRLDWAALWMATGAVALLFALIPKKQQGQDGPGFVSALLVPLMWFACYVSQGIVQQSADILLAAVTFTLWVGVIVISAGWPEPPRLDGLDRKTGG